VTSGRTSSLLLYQARGRKKSKKRHFFPSSPNPLGKGYGLGVLKAIIITSTKNPIMPVTTMLVVALALIAVGKKSRAFR
jgi:hypothetical protein